MGSRANKVLVTRPAEHQEALIECLDAAGFISISLPLIRIEPIDLDQHNFIRSCFLNLDLYQAVIFVSRNAARIGTELIDQFWPQLPVGIRWYSIGSGTAETLAPLGIPIRINEGIDSEALLNDPHLQQCDQQRILIIKGEGGRNLLKETLAARGARVDEAEVYRRLLPKYEKNELNEKINSELDAILITSGEALQNLKLLSPDENRITDTILIVPSRRIELLAESLGFTKIIVAKGADNSAMLTALNTRFG